MVINAPNRSRTCVVRKPRGGPPWLQLVEPAGQSLDGYPLRPIPAEGDRAAAPRCKPTSHAPASRDSRTSVRHEEGPHGSTHFLAKTLPKVAAEMALSVLAYNLTRVINVVGTKPLMAAIAA